jgi:serine/threonine protein kinase/predicted Zn-dependent protease
VSAAERSCPGCGGELPAGDESCSACALTTATATAAEHTMTAPTVAGDPIAGAELDASVPTQIADYRILRELGSGGMGTVFEAHETKMDRRVALKILSRHHGSAEKADQRFAREAWIAGRLSHPNLVKVFERGDWQELSYYSMELVHGGSLHDVIRNMKQWGRDDGLGLEFGTPAYVQWAIDMIIAAARGLDYAHRQGIVHRDIKPMNLLLSKESRTVKITDFGLALDQEASRMTTAGKVLGTVIYMAPEQITGSSREVGPRTDIYALGVTLFELLTLELPFVGETQQGYMNAVLTVEARRPSKLNERVGRDLEIVIRKALEKAPQDRYASARDFADDLENVLHFRPIQAQPPGRVLRLWKWTRRKPFQTALILIALLGTPTFGYLFSRAIEHRRLEREDRIETLWQQVRWHSQRSEDREILAPSTEILELDPGHLRARESRAMALTALAERAADDAERNEFQRRALQDATHIVDLQPDEAWSHRLRAFLLREFGREDEAARAEELAAQAGYTENTAEDIFFDAHLAFAGGDFERAAEMFSDLQVLRPASTDPVEFRALALEELGRIEPAIQDYRMVVALDPDDFIAHYNLGRSLTRAGHLEEGARYLRKGLLLEPENALAHQALADNYLEQGRLATAEGDLESAMEWFVSAEEEARLALASDPGQAWTHVNLGASLMEQNRLLAEPSSERIDEAVSHYESALELWKNDTGHPAYGAALENTCDALIQAGELSRALQVCLEVTERWPDGAIGFYNLAGVHAQMGNRDAALAALERDVDLGDDDWGYLEADPWFESLRSDPRYVELIARMKR